MTSARSMRVPVSGLDVAQRDRMYALMTQHYGGVTRDDFERDLSEKDEAVLIYNGEIQGFSTLMRLRATVEDRAVVGVFSGDTIVHPKFWGEHGLVREVSRYMLDSMGAGHDTYWLLISKGYKTFRYLPLFFRTFLPHPDRSGTPHEEHVQDALASTKFGDAYDPSSGIVRPKARQWLRPGVADVTSSHLNDRFVRHFLHLNPHWSEGDELVCLAPIRQENFTRAWRRLQRSDPE